MAEKVKSYQFSRRFKKEYRSLPKEVKKTFDEKLRLFLQDMSHPSLRVKRIQGTNDRWEGSVTKRYRFTFQFLDKGVLFRAIGTLERGGGSREPNQKTRWQRTEDSKSQRAEPQRSEG
jgi:mRNA-degrading endonuclease RelE of RelBE toxin-antitoxin system